MRYSLSNPATCFYSSNTFLEIHDRGPLVFEDGFIGVHAYEELFAQAASLQRCACVPVVRKVKAAVNPNSVCGYGNILLRIHGPVSGFGYAFLHIFGQLRSGVENEGKRILFCSAWFLEVVL
jgi:hypothetical protein